MMLKQIRSVCPRCGYGRKPQALPITEAKRRAYERMAEAYRPMVEEMKRNMAMNKRLQEIGVSALGLKREEISDVEQSPKGIERGRAK